MLLLLLLTCQLARLLCRQQTLEAGPDDLLVRLPRRHATNGAQRSWSILSARPLVDILERGAFIFGQIIGLEQHRLRKAIDFDCVSSLGGVEACAHSVLAVQLGSSRQAGDSDGAANKLCARLGGPWLWHRLFCCLC